MTAVPGMSRNMRARSRLTRICADAPGYRHIHRRQGLLADDAVGVESVAALEVDNGLFKSGIKGLFIGNRGGADPLPPAGVGAVAQSGARCRPV